MCQPTYHAWRVSILAAVLLSWGLSVGRDKPTTISEAIADLAQQTRDIEILDAVRCLTGLLLILALIVAMRNMWALAAVEHTPTDESVRDPA